MRKLQVCFRVVKKSISSLCTQPHKLYAVVAVLGTLSFALITPPFQGPDEPAHYVRVQYIAHGHLIPTNTEKNGISLPESIRDTIKLTFFKDDIRGLTAKKYNFNYTKEAIKKPFNSDKRYSPLMVSYNFLTYLPAAPGVFFSNLLNLSPVISLYVARISLALSSVAIVYFAIKLLPNKKYLFIFITLIPMMLFQQSMVGTDGVSYAVLMLFLAYVFYLYAQHTDIQRNQWIKLIILCGAIVWCKPLLYLFLPLIIILVKKKGFWCWSIAAATISLLLLGTNTLMTSNAAKYNINSARDGVGSLPDHIQPDKQLQNLKDHPKRGVRVLWNSYMTPFGDDEVRGVIGTFGAADTLYPLWMSYVYVFVLGIVAMVSLEKNKQTLTVPRYWRWLAVLLAIIHFIAVNLAIYLAYTPYNFDIVYGVQGRYFLPTLIIIFMALFLGRGTELKSRDRQTIVAVSSLGVFVMVVLAILVTFQRYFMYTP